MILVGPTLRQYSLEGATVMLAKGVVLPVILHVETPAGHISGYVKQGARVLPARASFKSHASCHIRVVVCTI